MPEENQELVNQTSATNGNDIVSRLDGIKEFRIKARLAKTKQTQDALELQSNQNFEQSLNVTNPKLSQKLNQASQSDAVASMIKSYAERNGDDWSDLNTTNEILAEYYRLNPDDETYNRISDFTNSTRDPKEFGIEMGWVDGEVKQPVPETFMDKAKNSVIGPFARAVGALGGGLWGIGEGVVDASKRPGEFEQWQIDRGYIDENGNATDIDLKQAIKWYGKFFGTLGNMLGDVVGGGFMGAVEGFTTNQEQEAAKDKVAEVVAALINSEPGEKVQTMYNNLDEDQKLELKDWASILDGLSDLPLSWLGGKVAKEGIKQTIKAGESEFVERGIKQIDDVVEGVANKRAIKNKPGNIKEIRNIANTIGQGDVGDIDNSIKAIKSILSTSNPKEINDFISLREAGSKRVKELADQIDANLASKKGVIKALDQHIVMVDGKEEGKVIEDAINDLLDVYKKQRNPEKVNEVLDFQQKVMTDGVGYKDFNDFTRQYGSTMDAWNKKNQLTTDAKVGSENTRQGLKELLHERVPDAEFKNLDAEMGSVINFNKLVDTTVKKVNDIEKKLRDKGLVEEVREARSDFRSAIRGDLRGDTQTLYSIQETLPEKLGMFDDLSKAIDRAETAEQTLDAIKKAKQGINAE